MKFRKDINGLRAFAVIAVVLFHFNPSWMPGGFAGVDVFFVISGFLMTAIIFKGLESNNFSILNFYVARANRIIPALAALCLILLIFGWFYLSPIEYETLGKHAASSLVFLSNITYWNEAGYFDATALQKWLLHTWSLSVEWQFYILYPLVLVILHKFFSLKFLKIIVLIGTVFGFIFSVYATYKWPGAAYYSFPTRAWEMMLGGVAFLYPMHIQENRKRVVELLGLVLIISSYFLISGDSPWPGYLALFPVLGSFLIIQAQRSASVFTGNIIFQKLGSWSYSIYLWHWPLVVIIYTFSLPNQYIYIGIAISVLFGFLSYKYIERIKFSRSFPTLLGYLKCKPIYLALLVGLLAHSIYKKEGIYDRYSQEIQNQLKAISAQKNTKFQYKPCGTDGLRVFCSKSYGTNPSYILLGDSHAQAAYNGLLEALESKRDFKGLRFYYETGCVFIKDIDKVYPTMKKCSSIANKSLDEINTLYPHTPVIYINRLSNTILGDNRNAVKQSDINLFPEFKKQYYETIEMLSKNRKVYILTPVPEYEYNMVNETTRKYLRGSSEVTIPVQEYKKRNELASNLLNLVSKLNNVQVLDVKPYFCDKKYCYGERGYMPLYVDDDHISDYGSKTLIPLFKQIE